MSKPVIDTYFAGIEQPHQLVPYLHRGDWSLHDLVTPWIDKFGPADVSILSFNISEESLRAFFMEERISRLRMVVDTSVQRHKLDLLLFAASISPEIRVEHSHAKVLLVSNEYHCFGVVGSANLNRAVRFESGFWFTEGPYYDYFKAEFDAIFANAIPMTDGDNR